MKSYNEDFYHLFSEIADLMSILSENSFKIRAYRDAARKLKEDVEPITKKMANKFTLKQIPGIGDALSEKMIQFMEEGKIDYLEKLRREIPEAVRDLLNIPHLGPNRVRDLYINLNIKSKKDLLKKAANGEVGDLKGFGPKLVDQILDAIKTGQEKKKRHDRKDVEKVAAQIIPILKKIKGVKKIEVAGSYRRGSKTVGDLDILTVGMRSSASTAEKKIYKAFPKHTILASGDTKISFVIFPENLQVDIRFVPEESWGAALLYFTGSVDFNVMMRKVAIEKGYLLNEYGLFDAGEYVAGKTEEEVFKKLDLPVTPPAQRK